MGLLAETTTFTLDNMGRFLCNSLQEATDSAAVTVAGRPRGFDVIVIGGGTFGAVMASRLFLNDGTHSRRILVLEAGPFTLPEHFQNMPFLGGTPDFRVPWDSHPALGYAGLLFSIGGRSLAWGGWSPQLLDQEFKNWPSSVVAELTSSSAASTSPYFLQSGDQIGVTDSNDFYLWSAAHGPAAPAFRWIGLRHCGSSRDQTGSLAGPSRRTVLRPGRCRRPGGSGGSGKRRLNHHYRDLGGK